MNLSILLNISCNDLSNILLVMYNSHPNGAPGCCHGSNVGPLTGLGVVPFRGVEIGPPIVTTHGVERTFKHAHPCTQTERLINNITSFSKPNISNTGPGYDVKLHPAVLHLLSLLCMLSRIGPPDYSNSLVTFPSFI